MYGAFLKWGYPQIVHSWLNISLQKTTSYWGTPHLWKPPYIYNIYIYIDLGIKYNGLKPMFVGYNLWALR